MNADAACVRVTAHSDSGVLSHHVNASEGVGERCSGHVVAASDLHLSGISKNGTLNCVNNVQISSFETRNLPSKFNCINSFSMQPFLFN